MQFRTHNIAPLFLGTDGLTDKQQERLNELSTRHANFLTESDPKLKAKYKLTDNMERELDELLDMKEKYDNGDFELPDGAKTLIEEYVDAEVYQYRTTFDSKEVSKGRDEDVENASIELYNDVYFTSHKKIVEGDKYYELSYNSIVGHPDIVCEDTKMVKDAKSSWSKKTFPKTVKKAENSTYTWQVRTYLYMLQGMTGDRDWRFGVVFHALVDTPEGLVPDYEDDSLHVSSNLQDNIRITAVPVELTEEHVRHIDRRIKMALKYADNYKQFLLNKNK
jgi:hypothetical protein